MADTPTLSDKMRDRASTDRLPLDHPLWTLADHLDAMTTGFYGDPQTATVAQFMGAWAKARKTWCDYSGEALL